MKHHFKTFINALSLLLLPTIIGCSDEMHDDLADSAANVLYEVEVNFRIGTDQGLTLSSKSFTRAADRKELKDYLFVPDGNLIPQAQPPRQLLSSNNWQQVNDVRIYVFKKDGNGNFVYYCPEDRSGTKQNYFSVDAFSDKFSYSPYAVWWGGSGDANEAHSYSIKPMLPVGEYHFLAVARDDKLVEDEFKILSDPNTDTLSDPWEEGVTILQGATLIASNYSNATELFSGCTSTPIIINTTGGFQREIVLKRAVAGLLMYVENVPAELAAWQTVGSNSKPENKLIQGTSYPVDAMAVCNGQGFSDQVLLYDRSALELNVVQTARLGDYFLMLDFYDQNYLVENGYYVQTSDNPNHPNSMFVADFIIPQLEREAQADEDDNHHQHLYKSLYLVFYHWRSTQAGFLPLQWWPIKLVSSTPVSGETVNPYYFPIHANQFYSLGERRFSDDGSTLKPENDVPFDLKKVLEEDGEIVIHIDPFWNEYYGGNIGTPYPGVGLDPEWGEHPSGELKQGNNNKNNNERR